MDSGKNDGLFALCGEAVFIRFQTVAITFRRILVTDYDFVILSTTATYFRCDEDKLNNIFLKYALQSASFVSQYTSVMAQSTRFQVPITAQRKFRLVLPPLPEQRAIATALSDVDALIASLDKLISKKRDMKQAAMQELLTGKRRLPGFSGDWEVKRLGEICPLQRGFDLPTSQLRTGCFPVVYSNGVMNYHACCMVK